MVNRSIKLSKSNSFFLFGARGTGKSTLLKSQFAAQKQTLYLDLLDQSVEDLFRTHPKELRQRLEGEKYDWVIIDEVQKLPKLLDEVHRLIEEKKTKFILSGSSARKLKRGAANLLAGRAFVYHLHPLTADELGHQFSLQSALEWGMLPKLLELPEPSDRVEFLRSYSLTYLKEEIQVEQLVRNLDPFRQFLEIAAQTNGQIVNYSSIAKDVGVDTTTVQNYFSILEDTLIGFILPPYHASIRKRQRENPKFYLFDSGVARALSRTLQVPLVPQTFAYGRAFEHFIILEIRKRIEYARLDWTLSYLRTKDDAEIDLIIDRPGKKTICVEIKSSPSIREEQLQAFIRLSRDVPNSESFCFSLDPFEKKMSFVRCLYWEEGLRLIF